MCTHRDLSNAITAAAAINMLLVLTVVALLGACTRSTMTIRYQFVAPAQYPSASSAEAEHRSGPDRKVAHDTTACEMRVLKLVDARTDPNVLGSVAGRSVRSPGEGTNWISEMLRTGLAQQGVGYSLSPAGASVNPAVEAEVKLVTAWVSSLSISKSSSFVLAVTFGPGSEHSEEKIYRGSYTAVNWASGEGEIQLMVDGAFQDLLRKLSADIKLRCAN